MKSTTNHISRARAAAALAFALAFALQAAATPGRPRPRQAATPFEARVEGFMQQSGYDYHKVKANSWYINRTGTQLSNIRVLVGTGSSSLAVGAVVVPKARLKVTADSMYKMMKLSYDLNYVHVCIDGDDDLIVLSQIKGAWLDLDEFKATVERVAGAADRAYGEMRPFLNTP
jgi:hypothetical protein